ncbi:hypothetical protein OB13_06450, partial [Pontibacter sp. HJ8]
AQDITITGTVKDAATGDPLIAASVQVKGTTRGAQTDASGNFTLSAPANGTLVVDYLGYQRQEFPINNQTTLNLQLKPSAEQLDEVVVTGYGTQQKRDVTGSIASVKGEEIARQPAQNPVSNLQGRVAGVQITNTGVPGASPQVRIRGVGSAQSGVEPLYVVDGVFVPDLNFLNPADIESMEILKDASSAAIYGVRAANGVVLVTTKRGAEGPPRLTYNGYVGLQRVTNKLEMADAREYATLVNEKLGNNDLDPNSPGVDWYDQVLRTGLVHNHQVGISGGSERVTYNFSAGYFNQEGIVEGSAYERITARLQTDFKLSDKINLGYNAIFYNFNSDTIPSGLLYQAFVIPPVIPIRKANGNYGDPADFPLGNFANPQATLDWFNQETSGQRLVGNIFGEFKFLTDFSFRSSFGLNYSQQRTRNYIRQDSLTTVQFAQRSLLTQGRDRSDLWLWENTLTYTKIFGQHEVTALLGTSAQEENSEVFRGSANDVPFESEGTLYLSLGDPETMRIINVGDKSSFLSYFGRLNYTYAGKYMLTASLRRDGSSKFPSDDRWDEFPAIGVGWLVSEEPFMQNQSFMNVLKLRASWGKLGNENIPTGVFILTSTLEPRLITFFGGVPQIGESITTVVPPTLRWEVVKETDIGLEMGFLNSRLSLEADWYDKKTEDAIIPVPVSAQAGASNNTILGNYASFKNTGVELVVNWSDDPTADFGYSIGANGAYNKNEVTDVTIGDIPQYGGGLPVGGYLTTITRVGDPIGSFFGYEVEGIFQDEQEVETSPQPTAQPGDFRYRDLNADGVIDTRDRTIIGDPNPRFIYGLNTNFRFMQFDLQLDIQGVAGIEIYNANKGVRYGNENYIQDFYDNRWNGPGTSNSYPSANLAGANLDPNDWYVESGDYIRIRNVQVGYTLSSDLMTRLKMQSVRFYVSAQNPLTLFDYNGFTPEVGGPPTSAGIDLNVYPLSAIYNFGVNVSF